MNEHLTDTASELLFVSFNVTPWAPVERFASWTESLHKLGMYCTGHNQLLALRRFSDRRESLSETQRREVSALRRLIPGYMPGPDLVARQIRYGSPWELVLTAAVQGTPWAGAGAIGYGALRALRELLRLKQEWDTHRADLLVRGVELERLKLEQAEHALRVFNNNNPSQFGQAGHAVPPERERYRVPSEAGIVRSLADLPEVRTAEMITDDDPRA